MRHIVVAIIQNKNQVILQKRRDVRLWAYPGGKVENGETYYQAVIRETFEETGLVVEAVRHIADFHEPQIDRILHIIECKIVGGEIVKQSRETVNVRGFTIGNLPRLRLPGTALHLEIALNNLPDLQEKTTLYPHWMVLAHRLIVFLKKS